MLQVYLREREQKKGTTYYLDYYVDGKRMRETLKIPFKYNKSQRKAFAKTKRFEKEQELHLRKGIIKPKGVVSEVFSMYLDQYKNTDFRKVKNACDAFLRSVNDSDIKGITRNDVVAFKSDMKSQYATDTVQSYFKSVSKIFKYAVIERYILSNPFDTVSNVPSRKEFTKDFPTKEDIDKLKEAHCPNSEVKRAYLFCTQTGLGNTDCRLLKYDQIKDGTITGIRGKNRSNTIPLNKFALELLGVKKEGKVFRLPSDSAINKSLRSWVKNAGISKHFTFYTARHAFASNLLQSGVDMETVRKLIGHSSYKHLLRYAHTNDKRKLDAVNRL